MGCARIAACRRLVAAGLAIAAVLAPVLPAFAWGDAGHRIVARIALGLMPAATAERVERMLAADSSGLTATDVGSEAAWADRYRDSDVGGARVRYLHTRNWHFADIELAAPDLSAACRGFPPLPAGTAASAGPAEECVVAKIEQFAVELADPATDDAERLRALQFLLHLVGDLHQPLHASDDHDRGGNDRMVSAAGFRSGRLHHYWDTEFVARLGPDPDAVASALAAALGAGRIDQWARGGPRDWALESFATARDRVYGPLPAPGTTGSYRLSPEYVDAAVRTVADQLSRAGVRLARVLESALGGSVRPAPAGAGESVR